MSLTQTDPSLSENIILSGVDALSFSAVPDERCYEV